MVDFIPRRFRGRSAGELFAAARRRCALETSKFADRFFDSRYGTETSALVENAHIRDVTSNNLSRGIRYEPTRAAPFRRVMRAAGVPSHGVFVDVGCGKGRVCMLAVEHGFARVVGIDYSAQLCAVARENLEIFRQRTRRSFNADIRTIDAMNYGFAGDETVLYLFNPFDGVVLSGMMDHLLASLAYHPREVWIVYHNPVWREVVDQSGRFGVVGEWNVGGGRFAVYKSHSP